MAEEDLARRIGSLLRQRNLTLALAESCTGGLIGDRITDVPGSSCYFLGGIVAYSNAAKEAILGVRSATLEAYGAVSPQCAAEMAQGARRLLKADIALSVTGIAGPTGGMPGKPVGLTYFHLSATDTEISHREVWQGARRANKEDSARAALQLLAAYLEDLEGKRP